MGTFILGSFIFGDRKRKWAKKGKGGGKFNLYANEIQNYNDEMQTQK